MSDVSSIEAVLTEHTPCYGIMASPNHWAYGDPTDTERARWFAHCDGDSRTGEKGCGWDSEPTLFETREEARAAALHHLAEEIASRT